MSYYGRQEQKAWEQIKWWCYGMLICVALGLIWAVIEQVRGGVR